MKSRCPHAIGELAASIDKEEVLSGLGTSRTIVGPASLSGALLKGADRHSQSRPTYG